MRLVLFTTSYPFDAAFEQPFIDRELPYLATYFNEITLVPRVCKGKRLAIPIPVKVEEGLCRVINSKKDSLTGKFINVVLSRSFYNELFARPSVMLSIPKFLGLIMFINEAELIRAWTAEWIQQSGTNIHETLFYTFWFEQSAMGLGLAKGKLPKLKLVSRAHGYDVYEERVQPSYWPCRPQALKALDQLFLASDHAKNYMMARYPKFSYLFKTAHLGVRDPKHINKPSKDGVFRIVSCSSIVPVKRIELLLNAVARAAELQPDQKFEWHHFGDGPDRAHLLETARTVLPANALGVLAGTIPNDSLMSYYEESPVDVFVNLSESEGGAPVSIQEAISYGIPVIATNAGGNAEIVSEQNGILLGSNPSPDEVAAAISSMLESAQVTERKRNGSRMIWQERFNAENNFRAFALELATICMNN
jgi:colanic acid/amylovoran biosynthesis glycosyltransferase